ncbi:MAG: isopentenyl transferase family protein, partial [Verrucomicrobiota bacterium]
MCDHPHPKLVVLLGTNASGKSALGIRLASHFGGEIISADSRQVYRGLDLGSGKITPEQARTVPHHLIDVAEATDYYSLAQYQQAAYGAIDAIVAAGKIPFLVGGTGLYISAIVEGYELVDELRLLENAPRIAAETVALHSADQCPEGEFDLILDSSQ